LSQRKTENSVNCGIWTGFVLNRNAVPVPLLFHAGCLGEALHLLISLLKFIMSARIIADFITSVFASGFHALGHGVNRCKTWELVHGSWPLDVCKSNQVERRQNRAALSVAIFLWVGLTAAPLYNLEKTLWF